jgi:hypothetical protein
MPQALITLGEHQDRVVAVVKGKHGLKNKSDAINRIIDEYEEEFMHLEVRPEYLRKLRRISKEPHKIFKNTEELREYLERK